MLRQGVEGEDRGQPAGAGITFRPGLEDDLEQLNSLYNHYVCQTHITFDVEPITMDARREWFSHHRPVGRHRLLVAADGPRLLGYASSSPLRPKPAYETSVETSIYLSPDATGLGIGTALYSALLVALEGEDLHRAYAGIAMPNPASVALHERLGFSQAAYFTEQGRKLGRYWDVAWYEKPMS